MKTRLSRNVIFAAAMAVSCTAIFGSVQSSAHKENGWYRIIDGAKDSISPYPIVTVKEFTGLRLEKDFFGRSVITGCISKHKLSAWADSTERSIGKRIGFLFNDTVLTAPRVNMRLESGTFQICTQNDNDTEALYRKLIKEKKDSLDALFSGNGWNKDTTYLKSLDRKEIDSIIISMDYIDACAIIKGFNKD